MWTTTTGGLHDKRLSHNCTTYFLRKPKNVSTRTKKHTNQKGSLRRVTTPLPSQNVIIPVRYVCLNYKKLYILTTPPVPTVLLIHAKKVAIKMNRCEPLLMEKNCGWHPTHGTHRFPTNVPGSWLFLRASQPLLRPVWRATNSFFWPRSG